MTVRIGHPGVGACWEMNMTVSEALGRGLLQSMFVEHTGDWSDICDDQNLDLLDRGTYPLGRFYAMRCVRCALLAVQQDPQRFQAIAASQLTITVVADIAKITPLGSVDWSMD
jgi:hypothetical protein